MTTPPPSPAPTLRPTGLPPISLGALAAVARAELREPHAGRGGPGGAASALGITGVTLRSAAVQPGDLFLAIGGSTAHGATFADDAAARGAVAVLTDPAGAGIIAASALASELPILVTEAPRAVLGVVAAAVYHEPSADLRVIGVTGTSGKTTTCYLIEAALRAAGVSTGLIGTVGARINGSPVPSALTTPEAPDLQALFAVMRQRGVTVVAMEVSSHALALGRVDGTRFAVGAFTNLSQDHLDFHGDMEHYFAAKRLLFDGRARTEVIVIDDEYGQRLAAQRGDAVTVSGRLVGDGVETLGPGSQAAAATARAADWTVSARDSFRGGWQLAVTGPAGQAVDAKLALPGAFNVTNAVTALACVAAAGIDVAAAAPGLATVQVPGRLQRVDVGQPFLALVDYAHKPAAVEAVLAAVRTHCAGRVIVVLGAGGDRDHGKRPLMGDRAARGADVVIVTDDNPRSEDPAAIRAAVLQGARSAAADTGSEVCEVGDRRAAIRAAVGAARPGDVVVVAGKGHEQGQEIASVIHPFSDVDELAAAISAVTPSAGGAA